MTLAEYERYLMIADSLRTENGLRYDGTKTFLINQVLEKAREVHRLNGGREIRFVPPKGTL